MRRDWRGWRKVLAVGAILWVPALSGCAAALIGAGAGAGTVAYIQGEHSQIHKGAYEKAWSATLTALKQMDIRVVKTEKDALGGTITARRADDTSVSIKEEPVGTDSTRVKIRIGMFGDQAASESIQARIDSNLQGRK